MGPKTATAASVPPGKGRAKRRRGNKEKAKDRKKHELKLKGWLKTPADWARFDAWAKVNAQPRKIPEPEPIVRPAKPLHQLRKRLPFLMRPPLRCDERANCKSDMEISLAALCYAKATRRLDKLSWPIIRLFDYGRVLPLEVPRSALTYTPSQRIIELSEPKTYVSEECREFAVSKGAMVHRTTSRERAMALAKKLSKCPDFMTDEERDQLFTPTGIKRSALTYTFTAWMDLLSLPSYKTLKHRNDKDAREWKRKIVEEGEKRGKEALERQRQMRRKQKERGQETKKRKSEPKKKKGTSKASLSTAEEDKAVKAEETDDAATAEDTVTDAEDTETSVAAEETAKESAEDTEVEEKTDEESAEDTEAEGKTEEESVEDTEAEGKTDEETEAEERQDSKQPASARESAKESRAMSGKSTRSEMQSTEDDGDAEERERKRKAMKNAWRYEPPTCKEDPYIIKKSALSATASKRTVDLATPTMRENKSCKDDPFAVKKSALSASASPTVQKLAKPNRPRSPIERPPKRETDEYGRVIYEKPAYGKKLPKVKPYKMGQIEVKEEEPSIKERPIDPIVYQSTIDPCVSPSLAKIQKRERKRAKKILARRREQIRKAMENKEMEEESKKTKGRGQGDVKKKKSDLKAKESITEDREELDAGEPQITDEQETEEQGMEEQRAEEQEAIEQETE